MTGWDTLAVAAALGAEPIPASFENKPRLIPSITTEPAKPPAMDWKSNAEANMVANTVGNQVILVTVVQIASAIYASAMIGTMMEVMMEIRFAPPKITNAVITASTMPTAIAAPI